MQFDLFSWSLNASCTAHISGRREERSQTENPLQTTQTRTLCSSRKCGLFTLACRFLSLPFLVKMSAYPSHALSLFSAPLLRWQNYRAKIRKNNVHQNAQQTHTSKCLVVFGYWKENLIYNSAGLITGDTQKEKKATKKAVTPTLWNFLARVL